MSDVPNIETVSPETLGERRREGKTTIYYTGGTTAHPNQLRFSPVVESRHLPWIAAKDGFDGYLWWSYTNFAPKAFTRTHLPVRVERRVLRLSGARRPLSSVRWELLREGIEDHELLGAASGGALPGFDERVCEAISTATVDLNGRQADVAAIPQARAALVNAMDGKR